MKAPQCWLLAAVAFWMASVAVGCLVAARRGEDANGRFLSAFAGHTVAVILLALTLMFVWLGK